jgi:hypothetical protein
MSIELFETKISLPCRNPRYTPDGKNGEEFAPVGSRWGHWRQASSSTWTYSATHGDIQSGWALQHLVWVEHPKRYTREDPLILTTPTGVRFKSHA